FHSLLRIWNIGRNSGAKMDFYAHRETIQILQRIVAKINIEAKFHTISNWGEAEKAALELDENEGLIIMMADRGMPSYFSQMREIPEFLNTHLDENNYMLIYPF